MLFARRADTVTTPAPGPPQPAADTVVTPLDSVRSKADVPDTVQLERVVAELADELHWQKERFAKLQNRVTTELREIRREVDRLYQEDPDDGDEDER